MHEHEWAESLEADKMIKWLTGQRVFIPVANPDRNVSERKLRLFAVACARFGLAQYKNKIATDAQMVRCIDVAEQYADDKVSISQLGREMIWDWPGSFVVATDAKWCARQFSTDESGVSQAMIPLAVQACFLREIFGNPYVKPIMPANFLTNTVVDLATFIYDEKAFDKMPQLGDAFEDAGCTDKLILDHCRNPIIARCYHEELMEEWAENDPYGSFEVDTNECEVCHGSGQLPVEISHIRGCYLLDSILGKQ